MRLFLFFILFLSLGCQKQESIEGGVDITGQWLQTSRNQIQANYVPTSRFGNFDYGLIFFDNGTYIDRSESGICIGADCLTENFNGSYRWLSADVIELTVDNYHGLSTREYVVEKKSGGELVLRVK